jgi:hypothetical protein
LPEEFKVSLVILYVLTPLLTEQETHHHFLCAKNPQPQVTQKKPKKCQLSQSHPPALPLPPFLSKQEEAGELEEMMRAVSLFDRRFIFGGLG